MSSRDPDDTDDEAGLPAQSGTLRVDKWLWFARIVKTRALAQELVSQGKVRLNRERLDKPSRTVRQDDVLTVAVHQRVRVLKVRDIGVRRGPASEAMSLYEDLGPPPTPARDGTQAEPGGGRAQGQGRPTKRDRRRLDRLKDE